MTQSASVRTRRTVHRARSDSLADNRPQSGSHQLLSFSELLGQCDSGLVNKQSDVCCSGRCSVCADSRCRVRSTDTKCCPRNIRLSGRYCNGSRDEGCVLGYSPPADERTRGAPWFSLFAVYQAMNVASNGTRRFSVPSARDVQNLRRPRLVSTKTHTPISVPWSRACSWVQRMNSSWTSILEQLLHNGGEGKQFHAARGGSRIAHLVAQRLGADVHARGVLCNLTYPCAITPLRNPAVRFCLPNSTSIRSAHVCQPWGPLFHQQGGPIGDWGKPTEKGCLTIDLRLLASWWAHRRRIAPFLKSIDEMEVARLLDRKKVVLEDRQHLKRALEGWSSPSWEYQPLRYPRCAFVGSGHDLRCGFPRGVEIDEHDAVFRANAAQGAAHETGTVASTEIHTDTRTRLSAHSISAARAGRRTDFRVSCLFNSELISNRSRSEVCIIPQRWWRYRSGQERSDNRRQPCCEPPLSSSYSLRTLEGLAVRENTTFHWLRRGELSGIGAVDDMLEGSGGSALHAAIGMCQSVRVYGAGLLSAAPAEDKLYVHAYDRGVGTCMRSAAGYAFARPSNYATYVRWRSTRVQHEMMLHVLHAVGAITWVQ